MNRTLIAAWGLIIITLAVLISPIWIETKKDKEIERSKVVYLEKCRLKKDLMLQEVCLLDREMEVLEKLAGSRIQDLDPPISNEKQSISAVFRYRLFESGELSDIDLNNIQKELSCAIHRVVMTQEIIRVMTEKIRQNPKMKLEDLLNSLSSSEFDLGYQAAEVRLLKYSKDSFENKMAEINKITWKSIPESRLKELQRQGALKYN
jgi:hypothetical protein